MKKSNRNEVNNFDNLKKFEAERLKNDDMYVITGGCTCGSVSMCHNDGTNEGDQSMK